jgi:hypothetical protein
MAWWLLQGSATHDDRHALVSRTSRQEPEIISALASCLRESLRRSNGVGYVPLSARIKSMLVILEKDSGRIRAIIDASPW